MSIQKKPLPPVTALLQGIFRRGGYTAAAPLQTDTCAAEQRWHHSLWSCCIACLLVIMPVGCTPSVRYAGEQTVNIQSQARKPAARGYPRRDGGTGQSVGRLEQAIAAYIGVPYKHGGTTRAGFDCSGFVMQVYKEVYGRNLPRTSARMWDAGHSVPRSAARPGDLVFFKNSGRHIDHVGIYLGDNRFVHASTTRGVVYDDLTNAYYAQRFAGIRRMK